MPLKMALLVAAFQVLACSALVHPVASVRFEVERFAIAAASPMNLSDAMLGTLPFVDALAEMQAGKKFGHYSWYAYPTAAFHRGNSTDATWGNEHGSWTSRFFVLRSGDEVKAFLDHPALGPQLEQLYDAILLNAARLPGTPIKTIIDGERISWFEHSPLFSNISNETQRIEEVVRREHRFVQDRFRFVSHVQLFVDHAKLFSELPAVDADRKAFYTRVHQKAQQLLKLCHAEGLHALSAPDEATWVPFGKMTKTKRTTMLQKLHVALSMMNSGNSEDLALPPSAWVMLPQGAGKWELEFSRFHNQALVCKSWCSALARILA